MIEIDFSEIFGRIPLLKHSAPDDFEITPLTGLTNLNFRLLNTQHDYVLRVPRAQTSEAIDRKAEAFNVDRVMQLGLAPKQLWRDDTGLSLTRCITRSRALTESDMRDERLVSQLVDQLAVLHKAEPRFEGRTDLRALLVHYSISISADENPELAACFEKAIRHCLTIEQEDRISVPSHNDLVFENLLIDQHDRLWIIDWEYSGMSSPYWDLATLCNVARFDRAQTHELMNRYNKQVMELDIDHLRRYQYMLQVLTIGWLLAYSTEAIENEINWLNSLDS